MKQIIIGFDLSFNSTGITISYLEDLVAQKITFHRILFDDQSRKKGYNPKYFKNINNILYRMPSNLRVGEITIDENDENNIDQLESTLKALILDKKIGQLVLGAINQFEPDEAFFAIENFVMPSFSGPLALKNVSGLIILQGYVRKFLVKLCLEKKIPFKLMTETPKSLKLFFALNGNAEKVDMLQSFYDNWDGKKLLPTTTIEDVGHINDVIDSFALVMKMYSKILKRRNHAKE